jgi:hypothetical protein
MAKDRDFSDCLDFWNQLITSSGYHQIYYLIQLASKSKETMSQITMSRSTYKDKSCTCLHNKYVRHKLITNIMMKLE